MTHRSASVDRRERENIIELLMYFSNYLRNKRIYLILTHRFANILPLVETRFAMSHVQRQALYKNCYITSEVVVPSPLVDAREAMRQSYIKYH